MRRLLIISAITVLSAAGFAAWAHSPPDPSLPANAAADQVVVVKSERTLTLFRSGKRLKSYRVALGRGGVSPKLREGDNRTPEGRYLLDRRNARSAYHRSLHVSYPNADDVASAQARGDAPGFDIMVHGVRNGLGWVGRAHTLLDWTAGCIAVTNAEIEEIWRVVPDGTPIEIRA
jgi:murein L,D-transpeptidase YafK